MTKETNYRKIWEKAYGKIPKDKDGRSYEIHHINGNHSDNRIDNLKLVTIQEHYDIHFEQGDYGAANKIASRMGDGFIKLQSESATLSNFKRFNEGTHPCQSAEFTERQRGTVKQQLDGGTHVSQSRSHRDWLKNYNKDRSSRGELFAQTAEGKKVLSKAASLNSKLANQVLWECTITGERRYKAGWGIRKKRDGSKNFYEKLSSGELIKCIDTV